MQRIGDIAVFGDPVDAGALQQIQRTGMHPAVRATALMADHHKGYAVPIGGVVAYENAISPAGVGYDVGCGNKAVLTDMPGAEARANIGRIMDDIWSTISFGIGRKNEERVDHGLFDDPAWSVVRHLNLRDKAAAQLGTVGSGNHYVDIFIDEQERVWVGVHFGSRGFGHGVATWALRAGGARDGMDVEPLVLPIDSALGAEYVAAMNLAGRYAYAGRDWVCQRVVKILGARTIDEVHNNHNYCLPGSAIVPTTTGPRLMADLRPGEKVYAHDEMGGLVSAAVAATWYAGSRRVVRVETRNRAIRASEDHPLLTVAIRLEPDPRRPWLSKTRGELVWKKAGDIEKGDVVICAHGYYEAMHSIGVEMARFVGAFLGDGWIRDQAAVAISGHSVGLAIGGPGEFHTGRYLSLCRRLLPANWKDNAPGAYGLTCSSRTVRNAVLEMGLGARSRTRQVPEYAFNLTREEKLALLAGYADADGSVADARTSNHGRLTFCSVNRLLVSDLRELAIGCGLRVTVIRSERVQTNYGPTTSHRFTFSPESSGALPLWHEAKRMNLRAKGDRYEIGLEPAAIGYLRLPHCLFAQRVWRVIAEPAEDVYDISVNHPSHSFVCEGVVVHNCWQENHGGLDLWVVRKGATPAFPGQRGFVGGSMGDDAVILEGVEPGESLAAADAQKASLYSTIHGAGRVMSRNAARGRRKKIHGRWVADPSRPGAISREEMERWISRGGVVLRGADTDEAPQAYKRLPEVLAHHRGTVRILHTLSPIGVAMAGAGEFDPYKD